MLYHYNHLNHRVEKLEVYISHFMRTIHKEAETRHRFSIILCHPDFRQHVQSAPTLKKYLSAFFKVYRGLTKPERAEVYKAFMASRSIKRLFTSACPCVGISHLPAPIQAPSKTLFKYLYKTTLNSVGNVKDHYQSFYDKLLSKKCPFCGIENLLHYTHYKQDYDHLLYKDEYPFAAVNMQNLVPMGRDCNTVYKKTKDILHSGHGHRRLAFYPFEGHRAITVSLLASDLPTSTNRKGTWVIELLPDCEQVATWEDVFCIKSRYKKDVLWAEYDTWLTNFINYAREHSAYYPTWDKPNIKRAIKKFSQTYSDTDYADMNFLRYSVCEVWLKEAADTFYSALEMSLSA